MALMTRLSRLFRADFHAVLDSIEEPEIQLKQAVRDMQFECQQAKQKLTLMQHEVDQLEQLDQQLKEKVASFNEELDICFSANEDSLARGLIKKKLTTTDNIETANHQRSKLQKECEALTNQIVEYQKQLDFTTQQLESLASNPSSHSANVNGLSGSNRISEEDVEIAFLREKRKRAES